MSPEASRASTKRSTLDQLEAEAFSKPDLEAMPGIGIGGAEEPEQDVVIGTFKRWSASAVECYVREANCDGCYYKRFFNDKPYGCKMNLAVEQLLETLGEPSKNLLNKYG
ncbi:MAG: hypothetical protein R2857_00340 [Vampirovibrionales bacterium]|nr:hypothetical protein [Cyanobacteria bacterium HKST-UBA05]